MVLDSGEDVDQRDQVLNLFHLWTFVLVISFGSRCVGLD